jgi:hypothetical protein
MNGQIVETNKTLILAPLHVLDKITEWKMIGLFDYYIVLYEIYECFNL